MTLETPEGGPGTLMLMKNIDSLLASKPNATVDLMTLLSKWRTDMTDLKTSLMELYFPTVVMFCA